MKRRFIIFGGTGDLTYRKLLPAFYNLLVANNLGEDDEIVIVARRPWSKEQYIETVKPWVEKFARLAYKEENFNRLVEYITYLEMTLSKPSEYEKLAKYVNDNPADKHICYMAVSPQFFDVIVEGIHDIGLNDVQLVMEKPFGTDLESAKALQQKVVKYFSEENVYRIDHYLGKDMVRNILTIRCQNPVFEAVWNKEYIDHINIFATETVGVEGRGSYYDHAGALRDMAQNHLLQLLSIISVDNPNDLNTLPLQQSIVLRSLKLLDEPMIVGQYNGYLQEKDIDPNSTTETFAKISVGINTARFQGVPFNIITGKKLKYRDTAIQIVFKKPLSGEEPNILTIQVQPKEGVEFSFNIKTPGKEKQVSTVSMDFCQSCQLQNRLNTPEAYEWMLKSIMDEDNSWFSHWDQIVTSWNFMDELFKKLPKPVFYEPNSLGPIGGIPKEVEDSMKKESGIY